jgi:replicative DNA helicase
VNVYGRKELNELKVIRAVLEKADVNTLYAENVDDFFISYGDTWEHIKDYYSKYRAVPELEIIAEKWPDVVEVEAAGEADYWMDQLREEYVDMRTNQILARGSKELKNTEKKTEMLGEIQAQLAKLNKYTGRSTVTNIMDLDAAVEHWAAVRKRIADMGGTPGIPTGVGFIDAGYPTGWQPGDLVVLLGWTGRAKSYFATLVNCNAYQMGYTPMMVSLEMNAAKIRDRVYTIMGRGTFQNSALSLGDVTEDSLAQFKKSIPQGRNFIVVNGDGRTEINMNNLQPKYNQYRPDIITLDYAQLMSDNENSTDMTARMRNLSTQAKQFAERNQCVVCLISSATADGKVDDVPPMIEQVAWSRQLAYDADLAIAVHKQGNDSDWIDIMCRKNRNGPLFAGTLDWDIDNGLVEERPKE